MNTKLEASIHEAMAINATYLVTLKAIRDAWLTATGNRPPSEAQIKRLLDEAVDERELIEQDGFYSFNEDQRGKKKKPQKMADEETMKWHVFAPQGRSIAVEYKVYIRFLKGQNGMSVVIRVPAHLKNEIPQRVLLAVAEDNSALALIADDHGYKFSPKTNDRFLTTRIVGRVALEIFKRLSIKESKTLRYSDYKKVGNMIVLYPEFLIED